MPTGDDDDEGWERVNAAFRPENEDKYDFGEPPKLPDDLPYDSELEKSFRNAAWQNGIHQRAAKNLYEQFVKVQMERHAQWSRAQQERKAELINDLQREAGAKYPVYVKRASSTIERYADPDFKQYLDETGLGNDPRMIRFMARVGEDMAGETRLEGKPQQQGKPQDIEQAIRKFEEDNKTALWDSTHPNHRALVAERSRLYEMRYGTDVVAGG
jgi:rubrerythrin